jgi:hypothetical protein
MRAAAILLGLCMLAGCEIGPPSRDDRVELCVHNVRGCI